MMETLQFFWDLIVHLDQHLAIFIQNYGFWVYALLFLIIFCETGLVVTPFLPGDSLLFIAGSLAAIGKMNPFLLGLLLIMAAFLGDNTNRLIGKHLGLKLFKNPHSKIFRQKYLHMAQAFYAKHGAAMLVFARFVPIIRTYAPFVAGMTAMSWGQFARYCLLGGVAWVGSMVSLGYFFGNLTIVRENLTLASIFIVFASVGIPALIHRFKK